MAINQNASTTNSSAMERVNYVITGANYDSDAVSDICA